jgi:serine/threonine-protein kinase HipA
VLEPRGAGLWFRYGSRYLERPDAVSLYGPQLPLNPEPVGPTADLGMPAPLRDAAPDSWGRRVILNELTGMRGADADVGVLSEAVYLMRSGSNRFGALDFQSSPTTYVPRQHDATLDQLQRATELVEAGEPLPPALHAPMLSGTVMGGARPKATITSGDTQYLAKFTTSTDSFPAVGAEAASIELARLIGISVPRFTMERALGKDVLLIERFDRPAGGGRLMAVSALTMLGLGELVARYGSYPEILDVLRVHGDGRSGVGRTLFERIAFTLTPAFDLSPGVRSGETAYQAIAYGRNSERESSFLSLVRQAAVYDLTRRQALEIVEHIRDTIEAHWADAADKARLTRASRALLWRNQFLNRAASYGLPGSGPARPTSTAGTPVDGA